MRWRRNQVIHLLVMCALGTAVEQMCLAQWSRDRLIYLDKLARSQQESLARLEIEKVRAARIRHERIKIALVRINALSAELFKQQTDPLVIHVDERKRIEELKRIVDELRKLSRTKLGR